ncbi:hypothetical protein VTP01DRAFT_4683 [Rhizomucor pusillus]|uniref:uncharacterized protein n=1 Tax=Rhizomucor pusillus TaxID=4840 RepID=UPI003742040E
MPRRKAPSQTRPDGSTRPVTRSQTRNGGSKELRESASGSASRRTSSKGSSSSPSSPPPKKVDWARLNPKTEHYEFGGPIGALAMIIFLPALLLLFAYGCDENGYDAFHRLYAFGQRVADGQVSLSDVYNAILSWNPSTLLFYFGFVAQLVTFSTAMPGETIEGLPLRDGTRLKYKVNALSAAQTVLMITMISNKGQGFRAPLWVYDNYAHIATSAVIVAFVVSLAVYIGSFIGGPRLLALGGNTGNPIYDFMIGRELNPRIGEFDIKFFTELRPGLLGWLVLNICMGIKQYVKLGRITNSMVLVQFFQAWYIIDALYNEASIISTMDITTDGFGFMLAFGNLAWVPIMYGLQARYLADFPVDLNFFQLAGIVALQFLGYYIFRSANTQKDTFRKNPTDPSVRGLEYIETSAGTRLLTSGWWGKARHINYLGDWLMSIAWCLPCGFGSIIPYFYCIYFAILLVHRERRDEEKCRKKYGKDWDRYCAKVKYRIIPGIY